MNISAKNFSIFSGGIGGGLKSTQQKLERQQKMQSQIDFFEEQKAGLKNMRCESLDEIARKLEMFNNYDAQIMAAKQQYNQEQMMHTMDEAEERGKQIAKAAEKQKPKTPEERRLEQIEEALGIEDEGGVLTELLEEALEKVEALDKQLVEEQLEEESVVKDTLEEELLEELSTEDLASADGVRVISETAQQQELTDESLIETYTPIDVKA